MTTLIPDLLIGQMVSGDAVYRESGLLLVGQAYLTSTQNADVISVRAHTSIPVLAVSSASSWTAPDVRRSRDRYLPLAFPSGFRRQWVVCWWRRERASQERKVVRFLLVLIHTRYVYFFLVYCFYIIRTLCKICKFLELFLVFFQSTLLHWFIFFY